MLIWIFRFESHNSMFIPLVSYLLPCDYQRTYWVSRWESWYRGVIADQNISGGQPEWTANVKGTKPERKHTRDPGCSASAILRTPRIVLFLLEVSLRDPTESPDWELGMERTWWIRDGGNGGRINKTLRFCRRCIDVVFILSSLMSTCELDRFVIQTPYIKVLKSCSAPFVDRAGIDDDDDDSDIDGQTNEHTANGRTYGQTNRTNVSTENVSTWINANSPFQVCALGLCSPFVSLSLFSSLSLSQCLSVST